MRIWLWLTIAIAAVIVGLVLLPHMSADSWKPLLALATAIGGGVALGLGLRRSIDRSTVRDLSRGGAPGDVSSRFEVSSYTPYRSFGKVGKVTTLSDADLDFTVSDATQSAGLRLFKRLSLSRRLDIDDRTFDDEVNVEGDAAAGSVLFAFPDKREAARTIFHLGFFGPHLALLAKKNDEN